MKGLSPMKNLSRHSSRKFNVDRFDYRIAAKRVRPSSAQSATGQQCLVPGFYSSLNTFVRSY
jgi:hypothetical protein